MQVHTQESVTRRVCEIPSDHHALGKSVSALLKASGYLERRDLLTRESVAGYLREHPDMIAIWQQYSEDQRTSHGWYFTTDESDVEVGHFHARHGRTRVQRYASREEACTEFILKEAAEIARGRTQCLLWVVGALLVVGAWVVMVFLSVR